jgi:hypothetical protein
VGRGLGAARPVPLVRMAVGGSGNRLVPLTGFALRVTVYACYLRLARISHLHLISRISPTPRASPRGRPSARSSRAGYYPVVFPKAQGKCRTCR